MQRLCLSEIKDFDQLGHEFIKGDITDCLKLLFICLAKIKFGPDYGPESLFNIALNERTITITRRCVPKAYEFQREKTYLLTFAPNEDSNQPAHLRILISPLGCPQEETLHHWISKLRPVKILIRLSKCAG